MKVLHQNKDKGKKRGGGVKLVQPQQNVLKSKEQKRSVFVAHGEGGDTHTQVTVMGREHVHVWTSGLNSKLCLTEPSLWHICHFSYFFFLSKVP